jgi:hypothetical protein
VYAGLGPSKRARLHAAAATALAEQQGRAPGRRLGEIALHRCEAAGEAGDAEAVDLAAEAAAIAMDEGSYEQAVALLTRALAVVPDGDIERRRSIAGHRARAFARLTHAILDTPAS